MEGRTALTVIYPVDWSCERTRLQLERYLLGALARADALAVAEHLEGCRECAERVVLYRVTVSTRG